MKFFGLPCPVRNNYILCDPTNCLRWLSLPVHRSCSYYFPLALSSTNALHASWLGRGRIKKERAKSHGEEVEKARLATEEDRLDHRHIGIDQALFTTHPSSPGAPFFLPDGMHLFQKLASFLRAQYLAFGFREVLTPTLYKESLWKESGHWVNYRDDMFTVTGGSTRKSHNAPVEASVGRSQSIGALPDASPENEEYGLKPMNCPGHCLLFRSQRRSYRDLPIRYAEFSPLHRNETSGALSGLTRVRRFHQDDGHIFCRPNQIAEEISRSLEFVKLVYDTLHLKDYRFFLSTRPKDHYIGTLEDWSRAEHQLKQALDDSQVSWNLNQYDGAFYGPKIDVVIRDNGGKDHQTATIQLDFQLPKRFDLKYESPSPVSEAKGVRPSKDEMQGPVGSVTPVMIHRAILGSLERFLALLLEHYQGQLPFWLSPRQVVILTVTNKSHIINYAKSVKQILSNWSGDQLPRKLDQPSYIIDIDEGSDTVAQKIVRAKKKSYNFICVIGEKNMAGGKDNKEGTLDVTLTTQPNPIKTWDVIERVKPGSQAPVQKDRSTGGKYRGIPGVRLTVNELKAIMKLLTQRYL